MFKISQSDTYWHPVEVAIRDESGKVQKFTWEAQFRRLAQSALDELHERITAGKISDMDLIEEVLVGWRKVVGDDGEALPFDAENLRMVMDISPVRPQTVEAFFKSIVTARAKN